MTKKKSKDPVIAGTESPAPGARNEYFVPEFRVKANCYDPTDPENPSQDYINFVANKQCITMPGSRVHAGLPVDANLAVHFICNFFKYYQLRLKQHQADFEKAFGKKDHNKMRESFYNAKKLHDKIIDLTYGMTLERDMLMKILSQPGCEGIRFYLCGRMVGSGEGDGAVLPGAPSERDEIHLSLVAVGVEKEGWDLNYRMPANIKPDKEMPAGQNIQTMSLTGEYVTPPPPPPPGAVNTLNKTPKKTVGAEAQGMENMNFDKRFVLLNLAKSQYSA